MINDLGSVRCLGTCGAAPLVVIDGWWQAADRCPAVLESRAEVCDDDQHPEPLCCLRCCTSAGCLASGAPN